MERWKPYTVRWAGVCVDGVAQGRGVLRAYRDGRVEQFFFGTFEAGQPRLGVIERPDGYVAGRFSNGKLVPDTDRNVLIRSFREGSTAAASLSKSLGQSGNKASASYYLEKSRQLAAQMD